MDLPRTCPSGKAKPCKGSSFRRLTDQPRHCDFQEMRVQEKAPESTTAGVPAAVTVLLRNTLVDTCQPGGDNVTEHNNMKQVYKQQSFSVPASGQGSLMWQGNMHGLL